MSTSRRTFIKGAAAAASTLAMSSASYANILGANDRIRVGVVGYSDRFRNSLLPAFLNHNKELNFELVGISDIWNKRRDNGHAALVDATGNKIYKAQNNEDLYENVDDLNAVIISTADFQHALHTVEGVRAGCDVYVEKPFAETMPDAREGMKAAEETGAIVQIGSQRRSGPQYHAAADYIRSGKFGDIVAVEMTWNVNQPGRWRRPDDVANLKESDVDWKRYLMNRPYEDFDPRKYLEYRLFWPYSSGIPGQWMAHQIDTVHWFSGLPHPRRVTANGGIYLWKDGRRNFDTMTAVFDYGPLDDETSGFQVIYSSRQTNSAGGIKEIYYSNGGELNLKNRMVSSNGGLEEQYASAMGMEPFLLPDMELGATAAEVATSANTGADSMTSAHMRNWMECVVSRETPNAPAKAGYQHSIANIMTTAALRTGKAVTFDEKTQNVMAGDEVFVY